MTKDDIKKGLEYCRQFPCGDCPYFCYEECTNILHKDTLELIAKQEKEIEFQVQDRERLQREIDELDREYEQRVEEIGWLKSECEYRKKQYDNQLAENTRLHIEYDKAFERLKAQQREIEKLKEQIEEQRNEKWDAQDDLDCYCDEMPDKIKQAQIDILNKAKEKFDAISRELGYECDLCGVSAVCSCRCEIDNLIKELEK